MKFIALKIRKIKKMPMIASMILLFCLGVGYSHLNAYDFENSFYGEKESVGDLSRIYKAFESVKGLNFLYCKLEYWPARLEKFFQDTVQNAIRRSDDTIMLKELLKLVSESSLTN